MRRTDGSPALANGRSDRSRAVGQVPAQVVAIVIGFAAPTCANDRLSDPFGNYTVEMNEEAYLFGVWKYPLETKCCSTGPTFTFALNLTTNLTTPIVRQYPRS